MIRALALLFALLPNLSSALCNGPSFWDGMPPEDKTALMETAVQTPFGTGNYWQATKGSTTLSIMGTMHLPDPRHRASLTRVMPELIAADLLLVEATLEDQTAMQTYMARNPDMMTLSDGATLPDLLDEPTWTAIRDAATARGVPGFMAAKMQPWFLSLTLAIPPCAMSSMVAGEGGLDNMLMETANDFGVPIAPLEPWQNMFDLLTMGTFDEQIDALRLSLIDPDLQDALIVTVVDFYFAEQSAMSWGLTEYTKPYLPDDAVALFDEQMAQLEQLLLVDRNAAWIPVIEDAASQHENIFIGFGAAHLFGEDGVLKLLENNGWSITPL